MWRYLKAAFLVGVPVPALGRVPLNALAAAGFLILGFGHPGFWFLGLAAATSLVHASHAVYYSFSTIDWTAKGLGGPTEYANPLVPINEAQATYALAVQTLVTDGAFDAAAVVVDSYKAVAVAGQDREKRAEVLTAWGTALQKSGGDATPEPPHPASDPEPLASLLHERDVRLQRQLRLDLGEQLSLRDISYRNDHVACEGRLRLQFLRRSIRDNLALIDDDRAAASCLDLFEDMGRKNDRFL